MCPALLLALTLGRAAEGHLLDATALPAAVADARDQQPSSVPPRAASDEVLTGVRVQGNVATADAEVLRLAGVAPGAVIGPNTLDEVAARLRASKRFDRVEVLKRFASIADPTQILLVIIVDEGPVRIEMTGDPNNPTRVVRSRWPKMLFLPVLNTTDGYGVTFGARLAFPDVAGTHSRISLPLTWGGDKRAGVELDKTFDNGPISRLLATGTVSSTTNPYYSENLERQRVGIRAEHNFNPSFRAGAVASWQHVAFPGANDSFAQFGADIVIDTRLDPLLARNAVYARAAWDQLTLAPGSVNRSEFVGQAHIGLLGRPILLLRVVRDDADKPLPSYLKPQLGGLANLRGFAAGTAVGDTLLAGSSELLVPLATPFRFGTIGVSGFVDAGAAYDKGERLSDQQVRRGYGGSVWLAAAFVRMSIAVAHGVGAGTRVNAGGSVSF